MTFTKILSVAVVAAMATTTATAVVAKAPGIVPIAKSTQVPPVPPGVTSLFGPNVGIMAGAVGVPGIVIATVIIGGVLYTVFIDDSSSTTTTP